MKSRYRMKQLVVGLLVLGSGGLTEAVPALAQGKDGSRQSAVYPLAMDDPRAQLPLHLVNARERMPPLHQRLEIDRDGAWETQSTAPRFVKGFRGHSGRIAPEPQAGNRPGRTIQKVFGSDDRTKVGDTTVYPWSAQCKVYAHFPDDDPDDWWVGSGTMIGYKYVLTAGHVIYDSSLGGRADQVIVYPGLDGTYAPFGAIDATNWAVAPDYRSSEKTNHDYGLIGLETNIGYSTGWFGYGYWSDIVGVTGNLAGYPTDKNSGLNQYYDSDPIKKKTTNRVYYFIDTFKGQSGSGVYRIIDGDRYVFAVHSGSNFYLTKEYNRGTRLTSSKLDQIATWKSNWP